MANRMLNQLYEQLYDETFSYSEFSHRLKMQKGIYLLQEMGVPVGEYRFSWYKHGPYSQSLLDDMHSASPKSVVILTEDAREVVSELQKALTIPESVGYCQEDWAECLGSLHYLKDKIVPSALGDEGLFMELTKRKTHLNDKEANKAALQRVEHLFS